MSHIKADSSGPAGRVPRPEFHSAGRVYCGAGHRSGIIGDDVYRQIEAELYWQKMRAFTPDTSAQP